MATLRVQKSSPQKNKNIFEFGTVELSNLGRRLTLARNKRNPVAWVIDAHLAAQKTMNDLPRRYQLKRKMICALFQRGMDAEKVSKILCLID